MPTDPIAAETSELGGGAQFDPPPEPAEPGKRKQDPVYHVFAAASTTPLSFKLLTVDERGDQKPVHASSRTAAISAAVPKPQLVDGEDERLEAFLVIKAEELQVIPRTTRRETLVTESFG